MEPLGILSLDRKKYTQAMAENLPALRARLGLSQTQLADCIGVTRQTISSIENQSRELSWTNFLSLLFLFLQNAQTAKQNRNFRYGAPQQREAAHRAAPCRK